MKRVIGIWVAAMGVFVCGCSIVACVDSSNLVKGSKSVTVPHQSGTGIDVRTANGAISVVRADRSDVGIVATIRAQTQERVDATKISATRGKDGVLQVRAEWPAPRRYNEESCSFEIEVPEADGVALEASNGALTIEGLSGAANLHTSNGAIHATGQEGPVEARTSNGAVHIDGGKGPVEAQSNNGQVVVREASAAVSARTSNGAVSVQLAPGNRGPVEAHTSNGSIHLDLTSAFAGELSLETGLGGIHANNLPGARLISSGKNRMQLGFGDSKTTSSATSTHGSITVRMRGAGEAPRGS